MKFVISESRLLEFIGNYIDSLFVKDNLSRHGDFILVWDPWETMVGEDEREAVMEYDFTDGRLWIKQDVLNKFDQLFNIGWNDSSDMIKDKFEEKFGVNVKYYDI
jgi:hypothetical protein